jgi:chitin synthase
MSQESLHGNPTVQYHLPTESGFRYRLSETLPEAASYRHLVPSTSLLSLVPYNDRLSSPYKVELDTLFQNTLNSKTWRQSRGSGSSDLRRQGTRKIKLVKGSVLSIDYPVPSAIINSIQPEYRDLEDGIPEEFTTLRCMPYPRTLCRTAG